ncbi:hypothetical protein DYH09_33230 [bacterium CPR1]|nr:hypothetical protein [bacterium CPR1]
MECAWRRGHVQPPVQDLVAIAILGKLAVVFVNPSGGDLQAQPRDALLPGGKHPVPAGDGSDAPIMAQCLRQ